MNQDNEERFWSEVGTALRPRLAEASWTSQRHRILSKLAQARPSRLLPLIAAAGIAGVIGIWFMLPAPKTAPAPQAPIAAAPSAQESPAAPPLSSPDLGTAPAAPETQTPADAWDARVTMVQGQAAVLNKESAEEVPAQEGMPLEQGDTVRTGPDGKAELALSPESVIVLGPNSSITLNDMKPKATVLGLDLGSLVAKLRWQGSPGWRMDVITPTAVAAVRGTEFGLSVLETGETTVGVFEEGKVAVRAKDAPAVEETMLEPRQEVHVTKGPGLPTETREGRSFLSVTGLSRLKPFESQVAGIRERPAILARTWKSMDRPEREQTRTRMRQDHLQGASSRTGTEGQGLRGHRRETGTREGGGRGQESRQGGQRGPGSREGGPRGPRSHEGEMQGGPDSPEGGMKGRPDSPGGGMQGRPESREGGMRGSQEHQERGFQGQPHEGRQGMGEVPARQSPENGMEPRQPGQPGEPQGMQPEQPRERMRPPQEGEPGRGPGGPEQRGPGQDMGPGHGREQPGGEGGRQPGGRTRQRPGQHHGPGQGSGQGMRRPQGPQGRGQGGQNRQRRAQPGRR
ncbi:MAG: FecR domain-containing protein [Elusimicrobia bacterium]|nr:FecR domain-containing protein [Elusimicrobiota bacterium]